MSSLRKHGYAQALKGPGGGLRLARKLSEITLLDIYRALGEPTVFAMGPATDDATCLVEQAVNAVLADALHEAEQLLLTRLGSVTLGELVEDFERRFAAIAPHQTCRR